MNLKDIQFLKELQHELLTQDKVSQADPRFWVIKDYKWDIIPDEYADEYRVYDNEGDSWTLKNFVDYLKNEDSYDEVLSELDIEEVDWDLVNVIIERLNEKADAEDFVLLGVVRTDFIVGNTMFLTIAEAKEHLKSNHYHYTSRAHVYAMTAWRAPKVERLIKLLQTADFGSLEESE